MKMQNEGKQEDCWKPFPLSPSQQNRLHDNNRNESNTETSVFWKNSTNLLHLHDVRTMMFNREDII